MIEPTQNTIIKMPNILLIAGNGRNAGKTALVCKIIQHLSLNEDVTGLKISPHFHTYIESDVVIKNKHFIIINETRKNAKDSSLMLKAGATKVYFVMVHQEHLPEAFNRLIHLLKNKTIVCESGGLHEIVTPGLFLFVKRNGDEIVKKHLTDYSPIIVNNDGLNFDFEIKNIEFRNHKFNLKN